MRPYCWHRRRLNFALEFQPTTAQDTGQCCQYSVCVHSFDDRMMSLSTGGRALLLPSPLLTKKGKSKQEMVNESGR